MVRALHFTDVHVVAPYSGIPVRDWLGKRLLGGANAVLRRNRRFADAVHKLGRLADLVREEGIELVLCTGDYTTLGTEAEYAVARAAVAPLLAAPLGYVHVPGNHDLYVGDTVRDIAAARANGFCVVAVATGSSSVQTLAAAAPDQVLESLTDLGSSLAALLGDPSPPQAN